jgi:transketolase
VELTYIPYKELERIRKLDCNTIERTQLFATLARINTLYMIMQAGSGHIGSSFSAMDIVSWLYLNEMDLAENPDDDGDIYFSSKGHDAPGYYSVLLGLGRLDFSLIHELRRLNGLPGHPDVEVPGIQANTGSLGMGISKAKGMVLAHRLQNKKAKIYVLTGDGELQEGQFWESLASAVHLGMSEITVIVDHNKIQSDTWVSLVNDLGDLEAKLKAFGWYVARCDGNDMEALSNSLQECKKISDRPQIIIADTLKGQGVPFMADTAMLDEGELYQFHSGAPASEDYVRASDELIDAANEQLRSLGVEKLKLEHADLLPRPVVDDPQRLIAAYSRALVAQGANNPSLVALDADLVLDCGLIPFREQYPERFVECGIAEMDMLSMASGLALQGMLPVVHSFACFLSTRPNEHFYNNATEKTKIIYVGSLAGLLPSGPGHSHQSVRDISILSSVPDLVLLEPCTESEVEMALDYSVNGTPSSVYLRLVSIPFDIPFQLPAGYRLDYGKGVALSEGDDAVMFSYGPVMLAQAVKAAEILKKEHGLGLRVINLPWLNHVDTGWLRNSVEGFKYIFTLDDHFVKGGQGEMLACRLAEMGDIKDYSLHRFGIEEIPACGLNDEVLQEHGLDAISVCNTIYALMRAIER